MDLYELNAGSVIKELTFVTKCAPVSDFIGKHANKYHELFAEGEQKLHLRDIAAFLNEKSDYEFRRATQSTPTTKFYTFTFRNYVDKKEKIKVRIFLDWSVSVLVTYSLLEAYGVQNSKLVITDVGSQNRKLKKPRTVYLVFYTFTFNFIKCTSMAIYNNFPTAFYYKNEFGSSFHYFVKHLFNVPFPSFNKTIENKFLFDYHTSWVSVKKTNAFMSSLSAFLENTTGYLHLILVPYTEYDHLETIDIDRTKYSILGGIYISPITKSLFEDNEDMIDGLMMDTTWKVINKYVTSILMCSSYNVGVSTAFAFGCAEDKDLYNMFIDKFNSVLGINLRQYIVESDQGSALRAVCDKFDQIHLACLRHFKVALKTYKFSLQISYLISARSEVELRTLMKLYSEEFAKITDSNDKKRLAIQLHKIGMAFVDGELRIEEVETWNRVSMLARIPTRMPSTTNALEATHGHLNEQIQRRNAFWPSLFRLAKSINDRDYSFRDHMNHSFQRIRRNVLRRTNNCPREEMQKEIISFNTNIEHCDCGETALESSMYRTPIPCSHMVFCGAKFPRLPDVDMRLRPCWIKSKFEYTVVQRTRDPPPSNKQAKLKEVAVKNIKRYSHYRKKAEIHEFVEQNYDDGHGFVLGKPIGFYRLIHKGIVFFSQKKVAVNDGTTSESSEVTEF